MSEDVSGSEDEGGRQALLSIQVRRPIYKSQNLFSLNFNIDKL